MKLTKTSVQQIASSAVESVCKTLGIAFSAQVRELESRIFDLEHALNESQQFERIASEKLTHWVGKHDELLMKYKALALTKPS